MGSMSGLFQSADWKSEKHVPAVEWKQEGEGGVFSVEVSVGREIPHPNTAAHHICWAELYFLPEGENIPFSVGRAEFASHGSSVKGADESGVLTEPHAVFRLKTAKPGRLIAASYCNIHGLWEGGADLNP